MSPLFTAAEVAKILRVTVRTVKNLVYRGILPSYRVGKDLRFSQADLDAFLAGRRINGR